MVTSADVDLHLEINTHKLNRIPTFEQGGPEAFEFEVLFHSLSALLST